MTKGKWLYIQSTGELFDPNGVKVATGYAGHGIGKNNPAMQGIRNVGPIPCGEYRIGELIDKHPTAGPLAIRLEPLDESVMFGRSGFLAHGDSIVAPGTASNGCIIAPRTARLLVAGDKGGTLRVAAYPPSILAS